MAEAGENPGKLSPTFPLACEDDSAAVCHCIQPIARSEGGHERGGSIGRAALRLPTPFVLDLSCSPTSMMK